MKIIISILLLTISSATHAQQIFEKIFLNQHGTACAAEDSDGHFIISFPEDTIIMKCDSNLNPIWTKTYDFSTYVFEILDDGKLACGGYKYVNNFPSPYIAILDSSGDSLVTKLPYGSINFSNKVTQLKINNAEKLFFSSKTVYSSSISSYKLYVMDTAGTGFQVNLYNNTGNNFHFNFIDPNKMVVASDLNWSGIINIDAFDSSFNHLWNNTIVDTMGNPHVYGAGVVFPNTTNGSIILGANYDWYSGLFTLDQSGTAWPTWPVIFFADGAKFTDAIAVRQGGSICIGTEPSGSGFAARIDSSLNILWYVTFNGINGVDPFFVKECSDGGFIISGSTKDFWGNIFPWITKVDQFGTTTSIAEPKSTVDFEVTYQNQSIVVRKSTGDKIIIYDLTGRIISKIENAAQTTYIPVEDDGIYIVSIYKGSNLVGSKKMFVAAKK